MKKVETPLSKAPKGKHVFGAVKVSEKGQIVIPKQARTVFDIRAGDTLVMLGDEKTGIAMMKMEMFMSMFPANVASRVMDSMFGEEEE